MNRVKKSLLWIWLLNKRLLFKIEFWVLLCIVPLLTIGYKQWVSREMHSMFRIAVYSEDTSDIPVQLVDNLSESKVFLCITARSEEEARALVANGKADAAWLLPDNLSGKIMEVLANPSGMYSPVITVVEREDDVFLQMSKMELYGLLYPDLSYYIFRNYMVNDLAVASGLSFTEEELEAMYQKELFSGSIFRFSYIDETKEAGEPMDYLLTSLRPFLALWLMLCGFVAGMYWLLDKERGTFGRVEASVRLLLAPVYQLLIVADFAVAMLLSVLGAGLGVGIAREIGLLLLLVVQIVLFCNLLTYFCKNIVGYGTLAGLMILLQLAIFPFFVRIRAVEALQRIFPAYYYFSSLHNPGFLKVNFLYAGILLGWNLLLILWTDRRQLRRR